MTVPHPRTQIVAVAAVAENGVIGRGLEIPWRIPGEQRHFKEVTMGGLLVMGRRTFDSIGRPLPGRQSLVVTRDAGWAHPGVLTAPGVEETLDEAVRIAAGRSVFVIGGGEIYRQSLPRWDRIELTRIHQSPAGDVFFPEIGEGWQEVAAEPHGTHTYLTLLRG